MFLLVVKLKAITRVDDKSSISRSRFGPPTFSCTFIEFKPPHISTRIESPLVQLADDVNFCSFSSFELAAH